MADFMGKFEKFGKVFSDTVDDLGKKAEDTLEIQKIKNQINGMKRSNDRDFIDIGKIIYERYKAGETVDEEFVAFCEEIKKRDEQIAVCEKEISRIKGE